MLLMPLLKSAAAPATAAASAPLACEREKGQGVEVFEKENKSE
jgi:hypothetical protein